MTPLHPPLPPPLSHTGIAFIFDTNPACSKGEELEPDKVLALIAASLSTLLPEGDLVVNHNREVVSLRAGGSSDTSSLAPSLWYQAGLLAGIERL
jgi:hypothetical protein